jgi:hypothetical protein
MGTILIYYLKQLKQPYLIVLFAILHHTASSQLREGFIINNNNDTINGYINFEGSLRNSIHCAFGLQLNGEVEVFKPEDIKAFRFIDSKYFITREILVDNKPQKVFLEFLIKGRASILTYTQTVTYIRYFLLLEDDSLIELMNTNQEIFDDYNHYNRDNKEYINLLKFYFRDCPSIQNEIETVFFDSKSLIKIAKVYHDRTCETGDCIIFEDKDRHLKFDFGFSANYINSNLTLNNSRPENVYPSNNIGFGLAMNVTNLPVLSPKFSAKINIMFQNVLFRYDTSGLPLIINDDKFIKTSYLKVPVQLTYNFFDKKLKPYISLGFNINLKTANKKYDQYLINYVTKEPYITREEQKLKSYQIGVNSGLGFNYLISPDLKVSLGYLFEYAPRFFGTSVNDYSFNMNNIIEFTIYYKFQKK